MKRVKLIFFVGLFLSISRFTFSTNPPAPCGPVPSDRQLNWQQMEYNAFIHLSINTFTNALTSDGNNDPVIFNPVQLDCRQWARICKQAGMKGIIITAKDTSGFCLWPSEYTPYSVKNAPWKDGKGDVLRELADACNEYGLKLGIYISPLDRNDANFGKPEYLTTFRNQLKELLTGYGKIFEVWFDDSFGAGINVEQAGMHKHIDDSYFDWKNTYALIHSLQPDCVIRGSNADIRGVGNQEGNAGLTNWSLTDSIHNFNYDTRMRGVQNGTLWNPAETCISIRPHWVYLPDEDEKVKNIAHLMNLYYNSVGRNASFLLNIPVMPNGRINDKDAKTVIDFAAERQKAFADNIAASAEIKVSDTRSPRKMYTPENLVDNNFQTYWATDTKILTPTITIDFKKLLTFNCFMIQEYIPLGQRVNAFILEAYTDGEWKTVTRQTTIGYKRMIRFPAERAEKVRIQILASKACPVISEIGIYNTPFIKVPPESVTSDINLR